MNELASKSDDSRVEAERQSSVGRRAETRKLRAHRVAMADLGVGELLATAHHEALGSFEAAVENLSPHGAAIRVPSASGKKGLVMVGDRIAALRMELGSHEVFSGTASVRSIADRGEEVVLGLELAGQGANMSVVYDASQRRTFAEKLRAVHEQQEQVTAAFKAWVVDLASYLESIRVFLDQEEDQLGRLDRWSREQAEAAYTAEVAPLVIQRLNRARDELTAFVGALSEEEHEPYRRLFQKHLLTYFACSPFMKRAYDKPLGYAGDYEMMNMLYRDHAEGESIFGRVVNMHATQEPAAAANINRLELLADKIREVVRARRGERARIASVGCGPAREIWHLLEASPEIGPLLDVALIDQEPRVIELGQRTLAPFAAGVGAKVVFLRESVRRLLTTRTLSAALGERDFIYSAGLFDYLNDRSFSALLQALYQSVVPGGTVSVGNVAIDNPTRWWMEYSGEWYLLHRSREDLLALGRRVRPEPADVHVESEPLGVNLFLTIRK